MDEFISLENPKTGQFGLQKNQHTEAFPYFKMQSCLQCVKYWGVKCELTSHTTKACGQSAIAANTTKQCHLQAVGH